MGSNMIKAIVKTASNMINADGKALKKINFNLPLPEGKKLRSRTAVGMILTERQFMRCLSAHSRGTTITINNQVVDFGFDKKLINRTGFNPKQPVYFVVR